MIAEGSEGVSRERNEAGRAGGFSAGGPRGDGCFGAIGLAVIAFGDRAFGLHGPIVCRANFDGAPARSVEDGETHVAAELDLGFEVERIGRCVGREHLRIAMSVDLEARASERVCIRSEEHTSELQSLMRISYAVFCLK